MIAGLLSVLCFSVGVIFWFWGTWPLMGSRSVLFKLHSLSVSDTLGSMAILAGLLLQIPREWPLLVLGLFSLAIWNTVLGYVLAYCSSPEGTSLKGFDPSNFDPEDFGPNGASHSNLNREDASFGKATSAMETSSINTNSMNKLSYGDRYDR